MKEEDMYPIVEEHFKSKLKDLGFELDILSGNASTTDLSLPLFGAYIKPDAYAIGEDKDGIYRILMGEGKLTYKGRDLDGVVWQGTSDQRFAHYVYLFFPRQELKDKMALEFIKQECAKLSLGLLLVDVSAKNVDEILSAEISPHLLDKSLIHEFERNVLFARNKIRMNLGVDKEVEYVHLATLRDLAILLSTKDQWTEKDVFSEIEDFLLPEYQEIEKSGKKSSMAKYAAKVHKSVISGDITKFKDIMKRNLNTLLFFDLVSISNDMVQVKPICKIMASLDESNKLSTKVSNDLRNFLTYLLLTSEETKKLAEAVYDLLKEYKELPVWARNGFCPEEKSCTRECGFRGKWAPGGQPFPDELKYESKKQVHKCQIDGRPFDFDRQFVTSILHCLYNLSLPAKIKIVISESTLVNQKGKPHKWSLGI